MRELDRVEKAARDIARLEPRLEELRVEFRTAVVEAHRAGASQIVIAKVAGISRERVRQLVARGKRSK